MNLSFIRTKDAPTPGAYSQGVIVPGTHDILFLAGQTGNDPGVKEEWVVEGGVGGQTTQALKNILAVVKRAGGDADSLVSLDVFLKHDSLPDFREDNWKAYNAAYCEFFAEYGRTPERGNMPARMQVWVADIPLVAESTQVEIRAIAAIFRPFVKR